ncbi:hypothetical protein ACBI99_44165 [Nonomuraea sp. ATR24]|uniref:hypothetical protein n=1 Tax=Nonomuraea sp. ATR24 TaxID=1676744 RepID=UPI0035BF9F89
MASLTGSILPRLATAGHVAGEYDKVARPQSEASRRGQVTGRHGGDKSLLDRGGGQRVRASALALTPPHSGETSVGVITPDRQELNLIIGVFTDSDVSAETQAGTCTDFKAGSSPR